MARERVGRLANASGASATALGANSSATFAGSTAIGTGASTTAVNQVSLGGTGSSVRVGDIVSSTAAQTGSVWVATVDAGGTLGRNTALIPAVAPQGPQSLTESIETCSSLGVDRRDMRQESRPRFRWAMLDASGRDAVSVSMDRLFAGLRLGIYLHRRPRDAVAIVRFHFAVSQQQCASGDRRRVLNI